VLCKSLTSRWASVVVLILIRARAVNAFSSVSLSIRAIVSPIVIPRLRYAFYRNIANKCLRNLFGSPETSTARPLSGMPPPGPSPVSAPLKAASVRPLKPRVRGRICIAMSRSTETGLNCSEWYDIEACRRVVNRPLRNSGRETTIVACPVGVKRL